jgi:hypothetical protein
MTGDLSVPGLDGTLRAAIAEHWRRRARSELEVGRAFAAMAPLLQRRGADVRVVELLQRGASDEERHSKLCIDLAETYAGKPIASPVLDDVPLPRFGVADDDLELCLLVSGMCCVNETIASAWLSASLDASTSPIAIAANRAHLRDEVDHARLGWAHLASTAVSQSTRDALATHLPALLEANAPSWERPDDVLPAEGVEGHGHLGATASRTVIRDAIRDLVIPGFAHVGVDTTAALRWCTQRHPR